jgi:hypothetical protein
MFSSVVSLLLLAASLPGQTPVDHKKLIARLGTEADAFERTAYRIAGLEKLTQTVPDGVRIGRSLVGVETKLPGYTREIVSEYGFVSVDEPGGSLREVRRVLTVDGLRWAKESKSLKSLAREMTVNDDKGRRRTLERFEEFGLNGLVTDLGQLILLFARGGALRYEIRFEKREEDGTLAYTYQQLDGKEAITVYGETAEPVRQKLHGRIWAQQTTFTPVRISIESVREYDGVPIRDVSTVEYQPSRLGTLLPAHIVHQQHVAKLLVVTDDFTYSGFRQVLSGGRR